MTDTLKRVIFFQVKDNVSKVTKILNIATMHFERFENLLILVSDIKTQKYVDDMLWKASNFLPHSTEDTDEKIVITHLTKNINNASFVFNLCNIAQFINGPCHTIYEFEDVSNKEKQEISNNKFKSYREKGFIIESH